MGYLSEVLDSIDTLTTGFWLIYPQSITLTFGKDQIPEFHDVLQYQSWLENRIRDALSCPSMIRLNNFVQRWSLRVRIEPDCVVCNDDKDQMEYPSTFSDSEPSCRGCFRTAMDYEPLLGGYEQEVSKPLVVEFYDNPKAQGEAVATIGGTATYQADPAVSGNARTLLILSRMTQTYLRSTPNRLINKTYLVDRDYISRVMERRFDIGEWIDEHSYTPHGDLPMRKNWVELRYNKPPGFGYEPAWKTVVHSDSLISLFG